MLKSFTPPAAARRGCWIDISIAQQSLYLYDNQQLLHQWDVSTARAGAGCDSGSLCTPIGWHRIGGKIGADAIAGTVFKGRVPTGEIYPQCINDSDTDRILTRILWLQGLESGVNLGGDVDSHERYIYIHATNEEHLLGQPASQGCVRMSSQAVITLFELVEPDTLVNIHAQEASPHE